MTENCQTCAKLSQTIYSAFKERYPHEVWVDVKTALEYLILPINYYQQGQSSDE